MQSLKDIIRPFCVSLVTTKSIGYAASTVRLCASKDIRHRLSQVYTPSSRGGYHDPSAEIVIFLNLHAPDFRRDLGTMNTFLAILTLLIAVAVGSILPTLFSLSRSYFNKLFNRTEQQQKTEAEDLRSAKTRANGKINKDDQERSEKWTSINRAEDLSSSSSDHSSNMDKPEYTTPIDGSISGDSLFMGPTASTVFSASAADRTMHLGRRPKPSRNAPMITSSRPDGVDLLDWVKTLVDAEMDRKMKEMEVHDDDAV